MLHLSQAIVTKRNVPVAEAECLWPYSKLSSILATHDIVSLQDIAGVVNVKSVMLVLSYKGLGNIANSANARYPQEKFPIL